MDIALAKYIILNEQACSQGTVDTPTASNVLTRTVVQV